MCLYIYIERERARDIHIHMYIYIYIYIPEGKWLPRYAPHSSERCIEGACLQAILNRDPVEHKTT